MATFTINSGRPTNSATNKPVELPPKGSPANNVNVKNTIGAIVNENSTYLFKANSAAPMQYNRIVPLSIHYTEDLGGVAKTISTGNYSRPPLNNSDVLSLEYTNTECSP